MERFLGSPLPRSDRKAFPGTSAVTRILKEAPAFPEPGPRPSHCVSQPPLRHDPRSTECHLFHAVVTPSSIHLASCTERGRSSAPESLVQSLIGSGSETAELIPAARLSSHSDALSSEAP
ncbi:hypothetical protein AAFF_G00058700 [Aldrovandia affinis]|uniref:Uncharacterized protein n=1 Tax=Aldrovandia affinis TaxID=143900 RepID=A0AAD7S2P4_9TELE|nr:hypothetical protein AAFF_G00058700 [Aldrovandia affinis]